MNVLYAYSLLVVRDLAHLIPVVWDEGGFHDFEDDYPVHERRPTKLMVAAELGNLGTPPIILVELVQILLQVTTKGGVPIWIPRAEGYGEQGEPRQFNQSLLEILFANREGGINLPDDWDHPLLHFHGSR